MTEAQKELYVKTKERLRRLGKENPADVIVALAEEVEYYRAKIGSMEKELDLLSGTIHLLERDIADRDEMLEKKVEEIYPEFMRDYKAMREELDGTYEELTELRTERDNLRDAKEKRAHWVDGDYGESLKLACSSCGSPFEYRTTFCPDCGARMEAEDGTLP